MATRKCVLNTFCMFYYFYYYIQSNISFTYENAYVLNKHFIIIMRHVRENVVQCTDSPANEKSTQCWLIVG